MLPSTINSRADFAGKSVDDIKSFRDTSLESDWRHQVTVRIPKHRHVQKGPILKLKALIKFNKLTLTLMNGACKALRGLMFGIFQ